MKKVSVIIPCLNEEKYICRCLDSLIANDYDHELLEIIVVDGMSTDQTPNLLKKYDSKYDFIKVLDNPKRITPAALNIAIKHSKSDIILRVDAHAVYEPDYISLLVNGLDRYGADNIGGIRTTAIICDTPLTRALSLAISFPFTAGNAFYRTGSKDVRVVDTVWCGCYNRTLFSKIGYFNENIIRTEDRDFNARIIAAGGKVVLDPNAKCTYFPRTDFIAYLKWNAYGPYRLFYNHKFTQVNMVSWRNFIPAVFILSQLSAIVAFGTSTIWGLILSLPLIFYWIVVCLLSLKLSLKYRSASLAPALAVVFAATHYGYGFGESFGHAILCRSEI